jgi:hypothetical protein
MINVPDIEEKLARLQELVDSRLPQERARL